MSDQFSNDNVVEELQRLGDKFAQDVLEQAEANLPPSGDEEDRDVTEEDVLLAGSELMPPRSRTRVGPALVLQFIVLTLVIVAVILLVFELTAKSLTHAESVALVVAVFGAFYLFSRLDVLRRHRSLERSRVLDERFEAMTKNLGTDKPAIVRLANVYEMANLADDMKHYRQTCINVLCGYLRLPSEPDPGRDAPALKRREFLASREVRNTIVRVITAHLRPDATVPWQDLDLDLTGADLSGMDFSFANLSHADLTGANLSHADLRKAEFAGVPSTSRPTGGHLGGARLARANLVGADLSRADLTELDLGGANLADAQLVLAILTKADLGGANLTGANLARAQARSAHFGGARLAGADFRDADLSGAWLVQSDLSGADFRGAVFAQSSLHDSDLSGALWDEPRFVPDGWVRDSDSGRLKRADASSGDAATST